MEMMFPGMAPSDDTDIMRTTKADVNSYNEQKFQTSPSASKGYDIGKNYDARQAWTGGWRMANATSNV